MSRPPSRTRLIPDRDSRSASASARSGSRKAVCGIRLTPRNRARAPRPKVSRPSLTVTAPSRPAGVGKRKETSSAPPGVIPGETGTESQSSVSSATWNGVQVPSWALGAAVTWTSSIRIEPLASDFMIWNTARTAPGGTGTRSRATCQFELPDQLITAAPTGPFSGSIGRP